MTKQYQDKLIKLAKQTKKLADNAITPQDYYKYWNKMDKLLDLILGLESK